MLSPEILPIPREMSKQKNKYVSWFTGHCKMGNLTQTKMDVQPASPLARMKIRLILVSLQTSNSFLGKCLSTLQTLPLVKFHF